MSLSASTSGRITFPVYGPYPPRTYPLGYHTFLRGDGTDEDVLVIQKYRRGAGGLLFPTMTTRTLSLHQWRRLIVALPAINNALVRCAPTEDVFRVDADLEIRVGKLAVVLYVGQRPPFPLTLGQWMTATYYAGEIIKKIPVVATRVPESPPGSPPTPPTPPMPRQACLHFGRLIDDDDDAPPPSKRPRLIEDDDDDATEAVTSESSDDDVSSGEDHAPTQQPPGDGEAQPPIKQLLTRGGPLPAHCYHLGRRVYLNMFMTRVSIRQYQTFGSTTLYPTQSGRLIEIDVWKQLMSVASKISSALTRGEDYRLDLEILTVRVEGRREAPRRGVYFDQTNRPEFALNASQWLEAVKYGRQVVLAHPSPPPPPSSAAPKRRSATGTNKRTRRGGGKGSTADPVAGAASETSTLDDVVIMELARSPSPDVPPDSQVFGGDEDETTHTWNHYDTAPE